MCTGVITSKMHLRHCVLGSPMLMVAAVIEKTSVCTSANVPRMHGTIVTKQMNLQHLHSMNANFMRWEVEKDNDKAIDFYKKLGAEMKIKGVFGWKL